MANAKLPNRSGFPLPQGDLSGLVAGDSAICGRLAALILRLRLAGLRFEEFRSPVKRGGWACDSQIAAG